MEQLLTAWQQFVFPTLPDGCWLQGRSKFIRYGGPQQKNTYDCGVYVMMFARCISKDGNSLDSFKATGLADTMADSCTVRRSIVMELLNMEVK